MFKEFIDATVEWSWKTRIYVSSFLSLISLLLYLFYDIVWIWGYAGSAFLLTVPLLFREKHVEFNEENAEELIVTDFSLTNEKLKDLLQFLTNITEKGFDQTKMSTVLTQVEGLRPGSQKLFNFYIITNKTKTSLAIIVSHDGDQEEKPVRLTSNKDLSLAFVNYMKNN